MESNAVTVVYKWIAKPGKLGELTEIYKHVTQAMHDNEPGATAVHVYTSEEENALYVRDEFADAGAMTITATGLVKQQGRNGDVVRVMNTDSKRVILARITGPGAVKVDF